MKTNVSIYCTRRVWLGEPPASESILNYLPVADSQYSLAICRTFSTYLLAINNMGEQKVCLLVDELEEAEARSLALAYLLHHEEMCGELLGCIQGQGTEAWLDEEKLKKALAAYIRREPARGTTPRYSSLRTSNWDEVVECLRTKCFIAGEGVKLIITEHYDDISFNDGESCNIVLHAKSSAAEEEGMSLKTVGMMALVGLLVVGVVYVLASRPKKEPVLDEPAPAPTQEVMPEQEQGQAAPLPQVRGEE